jgi:amino acid adenylation domain-containing protein
MSGEREVRVGVGYDGRTFEELKTAVGVYARYLPMDMNTGECVDFSVLAKSVDEAAREYYKWQNYFDWKQFFASNGDGDGEGYFPYLFEYEAVESKYSSGAIRYAIKRQYSHIDRFKVKLSCYRSGADLTAEFHYDSAIYDPADINGLADHYLTLLQSAAQEPHKSIDRLEILSSCQREMILNEFNQTRRSYNMGRRVHELIQEQAERRPEAVAVVCGQSEVSYKELNSRANRLAKYLRGSGVGPEQVVGVMVSRSMEMVVGLLGVMKAGGAYLPLDADYPKQRLSYILQDAKVSLLLTEQNYADHLPEHNATVIYLDTDRELIAQESDENQTTQIESRNLVYVMYTSGSTGNPKGAMLPHAGIVNCLCWMQETYGLDATDRFLMKTSLNFDPSVWELFWPLWVGGTVILAEPQRRQDIAYLTQLTEEREVTSAYFIPSMLRAFLHESRRETLRSLKRVICGGESLSIETANHFFDKSDAEFHHSYGPTETSIAATEWTCQRESKHLVAPIGKPLGNIQVYILDTMMQPAPIGVPGELYIGGVCVGRGYLNHADLTAERFAPDLFSIDPGARFYKTGDLARYLTGGEVEFCGRLDNQVKLRGYRIELGEVEAALRSCAGVNEAAVALRSGGGGEGRLVGYVVAERTSKAPSGRDLREYLRGQLPEYMIPSVFVLLDELPLMTNGKLNRCALPAPDARGAEERDGYLGPRTPVEEIVFGIFEDILNLDRVGRSEHFFELGGHSLLAMQVVSRVRKVSGVEIGVRSVFENPTAEGLASKVEEAMNAEVKAPAPALVRVERGGKAPLSFAQQRLWFIEQLEPGNAAYNIPGGVRLEGKLDLNALESAINEIVRRHEVLRTRIEEVGSEPTQVIDEWKPRKLDVEDLTVVPPEKREEEVGRRIIEEARTGFDLKRGPLLRVKVLKLEAEEHVALYTMHHIVSDAWSMVVMMKEVGALYNAITEGKDSPLPELKIQYADYAYWQRNYLRGEVLETHLQYWKRQLNGKLPIMELPGDRPRPQGFSYRGAAIYNLLPTKLSESLRGVSRREGATLSMVLLAAFKTLLYKYTAQEDVIVGVPWLNRDRIEIEPLIGFFVNMLPLRTDLSGNPRFRELLMRVKDVTLGAYAHQEAPFEKLVEEIRPERKLKQAPLYNVVFTLQTDRKREKEEEKAHLNGLKIGPVGVERQSAKVDLWLGITEMQGTLEAGWIYSADLFEEETIVRMHGHFETLLFSIVARPDAPIDELEILTEAERSQQAINQAARREFNYSRFKSVKPRAIPLSEG